MTPNIPKIVAEIADIFERYEQALIDRDVATLDSIFWNSPHTIRLSVREHGYGFDAIHGHRVAAAAGAGSIKQGRVRLQEVIKLAASVNVCMTRHFPAPSHSTLSTSRLAVKRLQVVDF